MLHVLTPALRLARSRISVVIMLVLIIVMAVVFASYSPWFLSAENLSNLAGDTALVGMGALAAVFLVMSGHFDLSIGAIAALTGVVMASTAPELGIGTAVVVSIGVGIAIGALNGLLVTVGRVNSIIVTFGTMALLRSSATLISSGLTVAFIGFRSLGRAEPLSGISLVTLIFIALMILAGVLSTNGFGSRVRAIGSTRTPTGSDRRWVFLLFVISGISASAIGLVRTSQLGTGLPSAALGIEVTIVTAVLLGGGRLAGGRGSVTGTVVAVLLMTVADNGLSLSNVTPYVSDVFHPFLLVVALLLRAPYRTRAVRDA